MSIFDKPWMAERAEIDNAVSGGSLAFPKAKVALAFFLAVVTMLFFLFSIAYKMRMELADWQALADPAILWLNTGFLVASSVAMQWAVSSARKGNADKAKLGMAVGGAFAFAFLIGQYMAWLQLRAAGFYVAANPANSFFYLITGMHGLHMLGGMIAWSKSTARLWRGADVAGVKLGVELCAIYWHFLLVVWLGLFALLTST